jgi:hypothetical protein
MSKEIQHGDYVRSSRHGHEGRVYGFQKLTNDDADWVACQNIPLTIENLQERFVNILVHKGGAVMVPESSCEVIPTIKDFEHRDVEDHFPSSRKDYNRETFYIMKAHHLTSSGRKLGLKKIAREEPGTTILVVRRDHGTQLVDAFIIGSGHGYGIAKDEIHGYVIDTGMGYKGAGCMTIIDVVEVNDDGEITSGRTDHANAYTWVMK